MRKIENLLGLIIIALLASACSNTKPAALLATSKALPGWYLNPPQNSAGYLYGIAEGKNLNEAREKALESMVSQLGLSISSSYRSALNVKQQYREYFTKEVSYILKTEVAKIRISNYEVLQSRRLAYNRFIVLVRSDKKLFSQGLIKELNIRIGKIQADRSIFFTSDVLRRHRFYDQATKQLNEMFSTLLILNTLDSSFNDTLYLETISKINTEFQALKEEMTFSFISDADSEGFKEELQAALTKQEMHVVDQHKENKNHITIVLHCTTDYARSHGFDIARSMLLIEVKDHRSKVIGANRIKLTGQATQGKAVALNNATKKLQKLIQEEELEQLLGIKYAL